MKASNVTAVSEKQGVQLFKDVCSDIDKALENFMSSITALNVQNVCILVIDA